MMFTTRTFCVCVSKPNLSCQFPSQSPFLWAFADTVHQNEKLIMSSSFLNILPEIQFFKNPFIFDWRIIALQYCVGFCHTATWISHKYTYVPSLLNPFSSPSPFTPLCCLRALGWAPCVTQQVPTWYLLYIW